MRDDFPQYAPRPTPAQHNPQYHEEPEPGLFRSNFHLAIAVGIAALIPAIVAGVVYHEATATRAADAAAVPSPTAQPGPPVPQRTKPVEKSPPVGAIVEGDGTWLVGKEIKRTTYESFTGPTCYWARLSNLSGEFDAVIASGFGKTGRQRVALGPTDVAFASQGCGEWSEVK